MPQLNSQSVESRPRKIVVTGSDGLIGWHFRALLLTRDDFEVVPCNRQQFNDDRFLAAVIDDADVIVHLAGMNRGDDEEILATNVALAERIIKTCTELDRRPHIIFSSSTHIDGETKYGQSKLQAARKLASWAEEEDARFLNLVLPHVFGEHGKPFYNSVVSTFAFQLANQQTPSIQHDGQLNLLHCHDVSQLILQAIEEGSVGELRPAGTPVKVSELLNRLQMLVQRYRAGVIPNLDDPLEHRLFNVWRSYLPHQQRALTLTLHQDLRGSLFEAIRSDGQGQVFMSTTHPGIVRGNHFHFNKVERFLVVSGVANIRLRKVLDSEIFEYVVSSEQLTAFDIPTLHTHNITNIGDKPLVTLFWTGEHFDPDNADTYFLPVELETNTAAAIKS